MAKGNAAIEVIFTRRGWNNTRYRYPCEGGGSGTAPAWHKQGSGLWIMSREAGRSFDLNMARKVLPQQMLQALLTLARAAPDPGEGADPDVVLKPLILAVAEQFPQALESDFDRMIDKLRNNVVKGIPVFERTFKQTVRNEVEAIATELLEEEVAAGKSAREVNPDTGEVGYRRVSGEAAAE